MAEILRILHAGDDLQAKDEEGAGIAQWTPRNNKKTKKTKEIETSRKLE